MTTRVGLHAMCVLWLTVLGGAARAGDGPAPAAAFVAQKESADRDAPDVQESVWRLYDLRDLIGILPAQALPEPAPWWKRLPRNVKATFGLTGEPSTQWLRHTRVEPLESTYFSVVDRLEVEFGIDRSFEVLPGVYMLLGTPQAHERFSQWLEAVRKLVQPRCRVRLSIYRVDTAEVPRVGSPPPAASPMYVSERVVPLRSVTQWQQHEEHAFMCRVETGVAESAAGYEPEVRTVEEGVELTLIIGAGPPQKERVAVHVAGTLQVLDDSRQSAPIDGRNLRIDLPSVHLTTVESQTSVPWGQPTVIAVATPVRDGPAMLIAVRVDRPGQP